MNYEYIKLDEEMECPCPCDCGKWFDLNDGRPTLKEKGKLVCPSCADEESEATVTMFSLRKNDRFIFRGETYTVKRRYISDNAPLVAVPEFGQEEHFYFDDDVLKLK